MSVWEDRLITFKLEVKASIEEVCFLLTRSVAHCDSIFLVDLTERTSCEALGGGALFPNGISLGRRVLGSERNSEEEVLTLASGLLEVA